MSKYLFKLIFLFFVILIFAGCGAGETQEERVEPYSHLIDSQVQGVNYVCGNEILGSTDQDGLFEYRRNCDINFTIGGVIIGSLWGSKVARENFFITELLETSKEDSTNQKVILLARFLQTLDDDLNATNGIQIPSSTKLALRGATLDFTTNSVTEARLRAVVNLIGRELVSRDSAVYELETKLNTYFNLNLDNAAPVFRGDYNVSVVENRTQITRMLAVDTKNVTYSLGNFGDSSIYNIDPNTGELSFKYPVNFEEYSGVPYEVVVIANDGVLQSEQNVTIRVLNEQDMRVVLKDDIFYINENDVNGTFVGQMDIVEFGDSNITRFELFGTNADRFSIDTNGTIAIDEVLDYEDVGEYNLTVRARNGVDFSNIANITIYVNNLPEVAPIIRDINFTIDENVSDNFIVGNIPITNSGDTNITNFILAPVNPTDIHFSVDVNGTIRVIAPSRIDFENFNDYNLTAVAVNGFGNSNVSNINITILNIPEVFPIVEDSNFTIDENVSDNFVVGDINISTIGDTAVYSIRLNGVLSNHFSIDLNGRIRVVNGDDILYENKNKYILNVVATNLMGDSNIARIEIDIRNIMPFITSKVRAHDRHKDDFFGTDVDIFRDYIVVGARGEDTERKNVGAAYIYKKNTTLGAEYYDFIYKLQPDEVKDSIDKKDAFFGSSVAMNEDYVAVSSPDFNNKSGVVYLYKKIGNLFELRHKFTAPSGGRFGASIAMNGTHLFIGATKAGDNDSGAVYIYDISNTDIRMSDDVPTDDKGLQRSDGDLITNSNFGNAISVNGNYLVVGAYNKDESLNEDVGAVYLYRLNNAGGYSLTQKILAVNPTSSTTYVPYANEKFGFSVDISNKRIIVGSHSEDRGSFLLPSTYEFGSAYLYTIDDSDFNVSSQNYSSIIIRGEKIIPSSYNHYDNFGYSVAINRDYFAISSPRFDINSSTDDDTGRVFLYSFKDTNDTAYINMREGNLTSQDLEENARLGHSLAISDTHLVSSAILKDEGGIRDAGAVYITNLQPENRPYLINYEPLIFFNELNTSRVINYFADTRNRNPINFTISRDDSISFNIGNLNGILLKNGSLRYDAIKYDFNISVDLLDGNTQSTNYPVNIIHRDLLFEVTRRKTEHLNIDNINDNAFYGNSIDALNGKLAVGAFGQDYIDNNNTTMVDSGYVYLYRRVGNRLNFDYNLTTVDANNSFVDNEGFGLVVDFDGDKLAVSSVGGTTYESKSGAVYLFRYDGLNNPTFTKKITFADMNITSPDYLPKTGDRFGSAIDQSGRYMAIGASGRDNDTGVVYVFRDSILIDVIENPDIANSNLGNGDKFGFSVSMDNQFLVIGAPNKSYDSGDKQGVAYVYERNGANIYNRVQELRPTDNQDNDSFGYSVAINGNHIAVGAPSKNRQHFNVKSSGAVYIYENSRLAPITNYVEREKLFAIDYDYYDYYGYSLDFKGNYIIIGAYRKLSDHHFRAGATFVVKNNGNGHFSEAIDLRLDDREVSDEFGTSVTLDISPNVVGLPTVYAISSLPKRSNRGALYLFELTD
jgi:hypothetical protein